MALCVRNRAISIFFRNALLNLHSFILSRIPRIYIPVRPRAHCVPSCVSKVSLIWPRFRFPQSFYLFFRERSTFHSSRIIRTLFRSVCAHFCRRTDSQKERSRKGDSSNACIEMCVHFPKINLFMIAQERFLVIRRSKSLSVFYFVRCEYSNYKLVFYQVDLVCLKFD